MQRTDSSRPTLHSKLSEGLLPELSLVSSTSYIQNHYHHYRFMVVLMLACVGRNIYDYVLHWKLSVFLFYSFFSMIFGRK